MTQKSFLLTSPEKFQQKPGNGSSNTDSPTPIGNHTSAILVPMVDWLSKLGICQTEQQDSQSVDSLTKKKKGGSGSSGVIVIPQQKPSEDPEPSPF